jgi:hypothetical protein
MRLFKEPILWFTVIGIILFAIDRNLSKDSIIVDDALKTQLTGLWQTQMRRDPSDAELESLVENWIREEVLYREALKLGLDNNDTIIRRRLVQKINFLSEGVSDDAVTDEDIAAYHQAHIEDYTLPARYTFRQVFVKDQTQSTQVLASLKAGDEWLKLGAASLLPSSFIAKTKREITSQLGSQFTSQLNLLSQGRWVEPIKSTFGLHLVYLDIIHPPEVTPAEMASEKIHADILFQRSQQATTQYYDTLREQYEIVRD